MSSKEADEVSLSGSEAAPEEDFLEADADASTEVGDEEPTEEYDTDVEAPEDVSGRGGASVRPGGALARPPHPQGPPGSNGGAMGGARRPLAPIGERSSFAALTKSPAPSPQAVESAAAREVARKERERLKMMDQQRRSHLEAVRLAQNADASKGEVRRRMQAACDAASS